MNKSHLGPATSANITSMKTTNDPKMDVGFYYCSITSSLPSEGPPEMKQIPVCNAISLEEREELLLRRKEKREDRKQ